MDNFSHGFPPDGVQQVVLPAGLLTGNFPAAV
jgi:hypothetical protein